MLQLILAAVMLCPFAEDESLLHLVPLDAHLVISVDDMKALRDSAEESAWMKFLQDPELEPFMDMILAELEEEIESEGIYEDLSPRKFMDAVSGGVTFFATFRSMEDKAFTLGFLVEPGEERDAFDEYLESFRGLLYDEDASLTASTDVYEDVELEIFEALAEGMEGEEVQGGFILADVGEVVFILADTHPERNIETAHNLIDAIRGEGEGESILDSPSLQHARERAGGPASLEVYLDQQGILSKLPLDEVPEFVGLDDLTTLYFRAGIGSGEELNVACFLGIEGEGLIREFVDLLMGEAPTDLFASMPANAFSASAAYLDINGMLKKMLDLFRDLAEEEYNTFRNGYEDFVVKRLGIDPEKDIVELLDGRFASFDIEIPEEEYAPMRAAADSGGLFAPVDMGMNLGSLSLIGVENMEAFRSNLVRMLRALGVYVSLKKEDFQGQILYSIQVPMFGMRFHWTYLDDLFCVSPFPSTLRSFVRMRVHEDQPSVKGREDYADFLEEHGEGTMVSIMDTAIFLKAFVGGFAGAMIGLGESVEFTVEGETFTAGSANLPGPEIVDEYFEGFTGFFMEVDEEGIRIGIRCW